MDGQRVEKNFSRPYLYVYTYGLLRLERNSSLQASESCASAVPQKEWEERPGPTLALLKLLICCENRHGAKSYLAGTLWPDTEEEKARHSLAQASRVLRSVLRTPDGKSLLIETSGGNGLYLAEQTNLWVDADAFEQEVREAIRAEHDERKDGALSRWERAYELGKAGTFLPDDIYQEWTNARRLNHDRLYRRCLHRLGECYLAQAKYNDAEAILRPFWVNHLTDEDILCLLMKVAIGRGDRSEALWYYGRTKQALQNELGVQPLASITSLVEQLRTNAGPEPLFLLPSITWEQDRQETRVQAFLPHLPASVSDQRIITQSLFSTPTNTRCADTLTSSDQPSNGELLKELIDRNFPQEATYHLLSSNIKTMNFRDEWQYIVNNLVSETKTGLRAMVFDVELTRWWNSIAGQVYMMTNLDLLKRRVPIKRIFLLSSLDVRLRTNALMNAYVHHKMGIHVKVCTVTGFQNSIPFTPDMFSVHDNLFVALYYFSPAKPLTNLLLEDKHIADFCSFYDELFLDDRLCTDIEYVLAHTDCGESFWASTKMQLKLLLRLEKIESAVELAKNTWE